MKIYQHYNIECETKEEYDQIRQKLTEQSVDGLRFVSYEEDLFIEVFGNEVSPEVFMAVVNELHLATR